MVPSVARYESLIAFDDAMDRCTLADSTPHDRARR